MTVTDLPVRRSGGLKVGDLLIDPPVVLAPMAGITNRAYRRLCREAGAGLYVSEMVTSRALVERNAETMDMVSFAPDENPRSVQLYGVDPQVMAEAVRIIVDEDRADHIDMNFGCPVPKVTRKGGGSALPWKRDLFRDIVRAAVQASDGRVPVSVKMRKGIDEDHLTYLDAGRTAAQEGVAWVSLHGRTAAQMYGDTADWQAIADLKTLLEPLGTPVLGNGDIWTAQDALLMMEQTGADGVVVGRGCLGRPWLFGQLVAAFQGGRSPMIRPSTASCAPCGVMPSCCAPTTASSRAAAISASTWPGISRDSASASMCATRSAWWHPSTSSMISSARSMANSRSTPRSGRGRGGVHRAIVGRFCPTAGSTRRTSMSRRRARCARPRSR